MKTRKVNVLWFIPFVLIFSFIFVLYYNNSNKQIIALNQKIAELDAQYNELKEERDKLSSSVTELRSENSFLTEENKKLSTDLRFYENNIVFCTTIGKKYHRITCGHMKDRSFYAYNLSNAIAKGYTPCLDCNPPTRNNRILW